MTATPPEHREQVDRTTQDNGPLAGSGVRATIGVLASRMRSALTGSGDTTTLTRGALWSFGITVVATGLGFVIQLYLTRALGPDQFGLYAYAVGWVGVAAIVTKFDFDTAAIRFVGVYSDNGQWSLIRGFLRRMGGLLTVAAFAVGAVAAVIIWSNRARFEQPTLTAYLAACALFPLTALLPLLTGMLQGFKLVVPARAPNALIRPFVLGLTLLGATLLGSQPTATLAIVCNTLGTVVAAVAAWILLRRAMRAGAAHVGVEARPRLWLTTAGGLFALSLGQLILSNQIDVVVVGTLLLPTEAGYYSIAVQLSGLTWVGVTAVLFMAMPMIAAYHESRTREELQQLVTRVARLNVLASMPMILGLMLLGRPLLGIFGPEFVAAYPTLLVLLVTSTIGAVVGGLAGFVMSMTGLQIQAAWVVGASSLIYLVLVIPLTRSFGPVGTALATTSSALIRAVVLTFYIRRKLGINVLPFPIRPAVST